MTKDEEQFLKCLLTIWDYSSENSLFRSVPHLFGILMSSFLSSLYILEISLLSDVDLVKIFSHPASCHFALLTMFFALQKFLSFRMSHLLIVSLSVCATSVIFSSLLYLCIQGYFHFIFYQVQCKWVCFEDFDPFITVAL